MAHIKDFIPTSDVEFAGWIMYLTFYVNRMVNTGIWTHIPADKVTAMNTYVPDWHMAYIKSLGPHTAVDTQARNNAKKAVVAFIRPFIQQYLKRDPVTKKDLKAMNLPVWDTTHTVSGT
jgi:hypothetical protein